MSAFLSLVLASALTASYGIPVADSNRESKFLSRIRCKSIENIGKFLIQGNTFDNAGSLYEVAVAQGLLIACLCAVCGIPVFVEILYSCHMVIIVFLNNRHDVAKIPISSERRSEAFRRIIKLRDL